MSRFAKICNKATMAMPKFATKQRLQCQNLQPLSKMPKFAAAAWVHKEKQQAAGARNDNN